MGDLGNPHYNVAEELCDTCGAPMEDCVCEPPHNDEVLCCPNCEQPNQFGELCLTCRREDEQAQREFEDSYDYAANWQRIDGYSSPALEVL